ncbi:MAG TPA: outer membrane protein assembly factor BamD [Thermoanaerobaculia bacterium]
MKRTLVLTLAAGLAVAGCHGGKHEDPILQLGAQESLAMGKELMAKQKYNKARPYFSHAFEVEPNSSVGREGLLLSADTYFQEGGSSNYVQSEAKYRDYLNRFPTSEQASYVQFQIANSLAKRREKPDRDQTVTRKSLEAYQELVRLYPTSEYAAKAQEQIGVVNSSLAEHEFVVGDFYMRYGAPFAAADRFEYLLANFPNYANKDKIYWNLGVAYERLRKPEEAKKAFDRLKTDYPNSKWVKNIPTIKETPKASGDAKPVETKTAKVGG